MAAVSYMCLRKIPRFCYSVNNTQCSTLYSLCRHGLLKRLCRRYASTSDATLYSNRCVLARTKHNWVTSCTVTSMRPYFSRISNCVPHNCHLILSNRVFSTVEPVISDTRTKDEKQGRFSNWTGKNIWKLGLLFLGAWFGTTSCALIYIWGAPQRDSDGKLVDDEFSKDFSPIAYIKRAFNEAIVYVQMIRNPSSKNLLPDPLEEPYYQPPYTLVIEMTGVLLHPEWTYKTGWRFKKRPNVHAFLQQIGLPLFEVVIYTSEQAYTAFPLIDNLDPQGHIMYRLFRDATRYIKGHHVKDLSCLNRDLSKVIIVDWNAKSYSLQPRNAISVKKWTGDMDDNVLPDLANFLRTIALSRVSDVREVLDHYNQFDDPVVAFRENALALKQQQQKLLQAKEEDQKRSNSLLPPRRKL